MAMAAKQAEPQTRVVLVGRTGVDAALRLSPAFELMRTSTPLEAMGEVAHPTGAFGRTVLVLSSEVVAGLLLGTDPEERRLRSFVESLKRLDGSLHVLAMRDAARLLGPGDSGVLDGMLDQGAPAEGIIRALSAVSAAPTASAEPARPAAVSMGAAPVAEQERGDSALVALAIRGMDVTAAAVGMIRQRSGDASVAFVPSEARSAEHAGASGRDAAVAWDNQVFGWLVSDGIRATDLGSHARWLAGWLRLMAQQAQLRDAAFKDSLTGAWNRRYFDHFLKAAIEHARVARRMVTVMAFDLDNFKQYNDRYGHEAGDEILIETVRLLGSVIRPTDKVCRIGGDEFAVIFDDPDGPRQEGSRHPTSVFEIAHRFQVQIGQHRFAKLGPQAAGRLTISGGLASFPWDGQTADELLRRADQLAMQSKRQGKNFITLGPVE